ncbi:MAG TPA: DUF6064 family protein [Euzebyales bacterium]|nr:DUF6064 family protein [Euzebyales bacterium]
MPGITQLRNPNETIHGAAPRQRRRVRIVESVWDDWRWSVGICVAVAGLAGLAAGVWTPHWPVTAVEALATMALGLAAGWVAGAALRSRRAMLLAPVVFLAVFEVVRIGATGPTVDAPNPVNAIALLASLAVRIVYGVLAVVPMLLGVAFGRAWALRRSPDWQPSSTRRGRVALALRRGVAGAVTLGLLVLTVALVRPATTDPIVGADGTALPDSIAEVATVELGGHDQRVLIRGHDVDNPVLLFLAGGPGGSELGTMARWGGLLERDFVVVSWDQRGTGASYAGFEPAATLTVDRAVADTIELSEHLRDRFDAGRIYVVGNSYGTALGVLAAQQRPDLYAAFVGTGQMVDVAETDRMFYDDTLAWAERTGDTATVDTLRALGPPPYDDPLATLPVAAGEQEWNDYTGVAGHQGKREFIEHLGASEYTLLDKLSAIAGLADTYATLYPQLSDLDLRATAPQLEIPIYLVEGRYEARGRVVPAREWFDQLDAPHKRLITFDLSGHRPFVEEPERFHQVMTDTVLADTTPAETTGVSRADPAAEPASELLDLFARYNRAVWPSHLLAYALAAAVLWLVARRPGPTTDRLATGLLAAMWLWLGVVYLGRYASQIDAMLGAVYAVLFIVQAGSFVRAGIVRRDLSFTPGRGVAGWVGWTAIGYALVIYPLLGMALGHGWPQAPLFGMAPCPSTIFTLGLLLLAVPPLRRHLLIVPAVWAVLAPLAAVGHGVYEDLGLVVVGAVAVALVLARDRGRHAPRPRALTPP